MHIAKVMDEIRPHMRTCARADVSLFRVSETGGLICAEIYCVVRNPLARRFTKVKGVQRHVRTCASLFRTSETDGQTALKFDAWLGDH